MLNRSENNNFKIKYVKQNLITIKFIFKTI